MNIYEVELKDKGKRIDGNGQIRPLVKTAYLLFAGATAKEAKEKAVKMFSGQKTKVGKVNCIINNK